MRTIFWENDHLNVIDQRSLPGTLKIIPLSTVQEVCDAIRDMTIRGAPVIGVAAAFGLALAAIMSKARSIEGLLSDLDNAAQILSASRPTAVNLKWAISKVLIEVNTIAQNITPGQFRESVLEIAQNMADSDVAINKKMAKNGAVLLDDGDTIVHHCNTGALATVDWGTALGVIRTAHEQGKRLHVLVDETRPRFQGSRLTAWELDRYNIPYEIISDNMAGYFLRTRQAQKVLFGADRIASNGDVANKIGSYMLALAACDNAVPVYSVAPTSTIDLSMKDGSQIPIEERDPAEVLDVHFQGESVTPRGANARNPAFDITPNRLITGIVTENGIARQPFVTSLPQVMTVHD